MDPKPYIRTFEAVLHQLELTQTQILKSEQNCAIEVQNAEIKHCQNIITSSQTIGDVLRDFGELDDTVGDISTATSILNSKLEKLSLQYEKCVESGFLINTYLNLNRKGTAPGLEKLWESSNMADKRKCANVVRQLQLLSRKLETAENGEYARDTIDQFAEKLERDLLNDFDNAYRSADLVVMKESADILTDFNGGSSVVQMFVNQHDYFILQENIVDFSLLENEELWTKMSDPEGDVSEFEGIMKKLVDGMEETIMQESEIIKKVFHDPVIILKVFLQRVFAQKIQLQIESYLNKAESLSLLAYMRTLHIGYSKISMFTASLKTAFTKMNMDPNGDLAALLDQNFSDIFVPYIENGQYFDAELKSLTEIIGREMSKFNYAHVHKISKDQSLLSRFTSSSDSPKSPDYSLQSHDGHPNQDCTRDGSNGSATAKETGRINQLMRAVRFELSNPERRPTEGMVSEEIDESDAQLKLDTVERILASMAESVQRDLELAEMSQIPNHARSFLMLLLEMLGKNGVDVLLEEAIQAVSSYDGKNEINFGYLMSIRGATNTVMLMSSMIKTVIYPMVPSDVTQIRSIVVTMVNGFLERVENKVNKILLNTIDVCLSRILHLLSKQKKKEFLLKDDSTEFIQSSVVSAEITAFLTTIHKSAIASLRGPNLDLLLEEIGFGFRDLLLEHFKKFTISRRGGSVLAKDVETYREGVSRWSIDEITTAFSSLDSIADLFTVPPQDITQLVRGNPYLSQSKAFTIRVYLSRRADYFPAGINKMFSSVVPSTSMPMSSHLIIPNYPLS